MKNKATQTQIAAYRLLTKDQKDGLYMRILSAINAIHSKKDVSGNPTLQGACISEVAKHTGIATSTVSARMNELKALDYFEFEGNRFNLEFVCKRASSVTLVTSECYRIVKHVEKALPGIQGDLFNQKSAENEQ